MWEAVFAIAGLMGTLAGLIRWLLVKYFDKQEELEALKKRFADTAIDNLKETVEEHKKELRILKVSLDRSADSIDRSDKQIKTMTEDLRSYVSESHIRMQHIESQILKLGNELIMIKGKPKSAKNN